MDELQSVPEITEEITENPETFQEIPAIPVELPEVSEVFPDSAEEVTEIPEIIQEFPEMEQMTDNPMHQMFLTLGVNLDYVPKNDYECFTMSLQFIVALWIISWFFKFIYSFMKGAFRGCK